MSIGDEVLKRYSDDLHIVTKSGQKHDIRIGENAVIVDLPSGEQLIMFATLQKAVALIKSGVRIRGPTDYKFKVKDERPTYAWAVLRDLGYVREDD